MNQFDVLSDVLAALRLRSDLYFTAAIAGPFAVSVPAEGRVIRFHLVREGTCQVRVEPGGTSELLSEGDLAIVPNGAEQILSDRENRDVVALADLVAAGALGDDGVLRHGDAGPRVRLLCGFVSFDESVALPLISDLPPIVILRQGEVGSEPWIGAALRLMALETDHAAPGMPAVMTRLLEIALVQAVRRLDPAGNGPGYLAAMADPRLLRALQAMHRDPARAWTVGTLAQIAGMSRPRFALTFSRAMGMPPMTYLTDWRLARARVLMRGTTRSMGDIAAACGYASVSSFTRRFKAAYGIGPGAYRRENRG